MPTLVDRSGAENAFVAALLVGLIAGACSPAADRVIDTWPIGEVIESRGDASCAELVTVGLAGLADRDPGHAAVVAAHLHREGSFVDPSGKTILLKRSGGCCQVLVVELTDGSTRAIGVGYPGISNKAMAIPSEIASGG